MIGAAATIRNPVPTASARDERQAGSEPTSTAEEVTSRPPGEFAVRGGFAGPATRSGRPRGRPLAGARCGLALAPVRRCRRPPVAVLEEGLNPLDQRRRVSTR